VDGNQYNCCIEGLNMYKHLLLPTDGSELSKESVMSGLALAKHHAATATAIHVMAPTHRDGLDTWAHHDVHHAKRLRELFNKQATTYLMWVKSQAKAMHVPCTCELVESNEVHTAILKMAAEAHCDLIFMAAHGWRGNAAQLPGSEALKVLTHSSISVLLHKPGHGA
jgi:nucleotide-binding universal stress UspA family protein